MMIANNPNTPFDDIFSFIASTPTPEQILAFRPSDTLQERVRFLLDKQRNESLTAKESTELDEFSRMNHFMSMLKIKARKKLAA